MQVSLSDQKIHSNQSIALSDLVFLLPVFMIAPLFTIIVYSVNKYRQKTEISDKPIGSLIILLSGYIGLLHSTRVVQGDQGEYLYWYDISKTMSLDTYLNLIPQKDWVYWLFTYFYSNILILNSYSFFFIIGFVGVLALLQAVWVNCIKIKLNNSATILLIVTVAFSADIFVWSMHLLRQNLAFSIAIYALSILYAAEKVNTKIILLSLASVLIHGAVAVFLVPGIIVYVLGKSGVKNAIVWLVLLFLLFYYASTMMYVINDISTSVYDRGINGSDRTAIDATEWVIHQAFLLVIMGTAIISLLNKKAFFDVMMQSSFVLIYGSFLFILLYADDTSLVGYRLVITVHFLLPLMLPVLFNGVTSMFSSGYKDFARGLIIAFLILWIVRFFRAIGRYGYPDPLILLVNPFIAFI